MSRHTARRQFRFRGRSGWELLRFDGCGHRIVSLPPKPARSLIQELRDVTPRVRETAVMRPRIAHELAPSFDQGDRVRNDRDAVGCSLSSRIVPLQAGGGTLAANQVAGRVVGPDPYTPLVILTQTKSSVRPGPNLQSIIRIRSFMSNSMTGRIFEPQRICSARTDSASAQ